MSVAAVVAAFDGADAGVVENAIPWLALQAGVDVASAPPALQAVLLRFAEKLGLKPGMSPADVTAAVVAHYEKHPLPPALLSRLGDVVRTTAAGANEGEGRDAAARVISSALGDTAAKLPVGAQPAPAGAMKNSPLARFTATVPPKK